MSLQLRGSDFELSYASTASGAPYSPPGLDGRKRRTRGSSEDDEDKTYPENFVNSDYRAGGPSLASVPVISLSLASSSQIGALREDPHFTTIRAILADWGVDVRDYGVALRRARYYPEDQPIPTVCIISRKHTLDESWVQAALEVRAYLTRRGFIEVSVEIADQAAFQQALCFPVQRTDSIYPLWDRVCNMILGSFDLKDWRIVECFRYGYSQDVWANPPTIMVAVDRRATRRWNVVREGIVGILRHFGLGNVAVRIYRGRVQLATDPFQHDIPETAFDDKARLGVSLGPGNNPYGSATFGGFVELLNRRNEWRKLGLTCYHAVIPSLRDEEKDSDLRKRELPVPITCVRLMSADRALVVGSWNRNGVFVSDKNAKDKLYPMQPSERDMNDKLEGLQNDISRVERDKEYQDGEEKLRNGELFGPAKGMHLAQSRSLHTLRALKAKIEAFRANKRAILGTVFAASGFTTQRKPGGTELRHLDWALIKMPAWRMGDNSVSCVLCLVCY
jgi:hypothetical protein